MTFLRIGPRSKSYLIGAHFLGENMPIHSAISRKKLLECHPDLQKVILASSERTNLLVVCGHRGKVEQNEAFTNGRSKLSWPHSKHNKFPSEAIDIAPDPLDWSDIGAFKALAKIVLEEAERLKIAIRWGGSWKGFPDFPHYELVKSDDID
jgi:peptidoglycan L-alanyl-D-glutamate endopeptidase CwlK